VGRKKRYARLVSAMRLHRIFFSVGSRISIPAFQIPFPSLNAARPVLGRPRLSDSHDVSFLYLSSCLSSHSSGKPPSAFIRDASVTLAYLGNITSAKATSRFRIPSRLRRFNEYSAILLPAGYPLGTCEEVAPCTIAARISELISVRRIEREGGGRAGDLESKIGF